MWTTTSPNWWRTRSSSAQRTPSLWSSRPQMETTPPSLSPSPLSWAAARSLPTGICPLLTVQKKNQKPKNTGPGAKFLLSIFFFVSQVRQLDSHWRKFQPKMLPSHSPLTLKTMVGWGSPMHCQVKKSIHPPLTSKRSEDQTCRFHRHTELFTPSCVAVAKQLSRSAAPLTVLLSLLLSLHLLWNLVNTRLRFCSPTQWGFATAPSWATVTRHRRAVATWGRGPPPASSLAFCYSAVSTAVPSRRRSGLGVVGRPDSSLSLCRYHVLRSHSKD